MRGISTILLYSIVLVLLHLQNGDCRRQRNSMLKKRFDFIPYCFKFQIFLDLLFRYLIPIWELRIGLVLVKFSIILYTVINKKNDENEIPKQRLIFWVSCVFKFLWPSFIPSTCLCIVFKHERILSLPTISLSGKVA